MPKGGSATAPAKSEIGLIASNCVLLRLGSDPAKAEKVYSLHCFHKKKKKDALGTFSASLSPTGQPQEHVRYFKIVLKAFILVCFVSEILIIARD